MVAELGMGSTIAGDAQLMEKFTSLTWDDPFKLEPPKKIRLWLVRRSQKSSLRRRELGENFAKLAEFHEAGVGIILEIPFRQRAEAHKLNVLFTQEIEIGGTCFHGLSALFHAELFISPHIHTARIAVWVNPKR